MNVHAFVHNIIRPCSHIHVCTHTTYICTHMHTTNTQPHALMCYTHTTHAEPNAHTHTQQTRNHTHSCYTHTTHAEPNTHTHTHMHTHTHTHTHAHTHTHTRTRTRTRTHTHTHTCTHRPCEESTSTPHFIPNVCIYDIFLLILIDWSQYQVPQDRKKCHTGWYSLQTIN